MSHCQQFTLSSITSTLSQEFNNKLEDNIEGLWSTEDHVSVAQEQIRWMKARNNVENCIEYGTRYIEAAPILEAMLEYSVMAGGVDGQRYTACAINTCHHSVHGCQLLLNLAEMWLNYFLYPFKRASRIPSEPPSENTTPDSEDPAGCLALAPGNRTDVADRLLQRDGGRCVITKLPSTKSLPPGFRGKASVTESAHFIRRSLCVNKYASSVTWDIVRHYTHMSANTIDEISWWIDEPENGMTLDIGAHRTFDELEWCLIPQEPNTYKIKHFTEVRVFDAPSETVVFVDRSEPPHSIPLPNREFVALHAAVAHVLHMSGAAVVIDEILDHFEDSASAVPGHDSASERDLPARIAATMLLEGKT
ncbi:hypothetical protein BD410DRAFT_786266 [Rickenella mellea]|uniref:HNH nuclease domain-containing protein n=1 Tax=Rickenella mellea TaxID=50990 RepID=A0A4Y7QA73_9AGAM|nr:hypothetical protein BD410DRAFT_786266 [Rickenella mellea]